MRAAPGNKLLPGNLRQAITPKANAPKQKIAGMEIIAAVRGEEAVAKMR